MIPELAKSLTMCGVPVFPCHDNKQPAVQGGFKAASLTLAEYWPSQLIGVPIPEGVVVFDIDTHKGMNTRKLDDFFQTKLPWEDAFLQYTPSGGAHYAFRTATTIRQGADLFQDKIGKGFDTRVPERGYICTGGAYKQGEKMGVLALCQLNALPELPAGTIGKLVPSTSDTTAPLPTNQHDAEEINRMLNCISADCGRDEWRNVALALKHHYHTDDATGWTLFNNWSSTAPELYDINEASKLWNSIKPTREGAATITLGTLVHLAIKGGYIPARSAASIFGDAHPDQAASLLDIETLIGEINSDGGKPECIETLTNKIKTFVCSDIQRAALTATLQRVLRTSDIKITEKELKKATTPDTINLPTTASAIPANVAFADIPVTPINSLGNVHVKNARLLIDYVFGERLKRAGGELYWWDGSKWDNVGKTDLNAKVAQAFDGNEFGKDSNINGTRNQLINFLPTISNLNTPNKLIFFKDGVLDPMRPDKGLQAHAPHYLNTSTLNVNFTTSQDMPEWDKFMLQCFGEEPERISLLQEIIGWWLISHNLNMHKAVAFDGASRSGKGTIFSVVESILGEALCDATLNQLADNKTLGAMRKANIAIDRDAKKPESKNLATVHSHFNKITANEPLSIPIIYVPDPWYGRLNCKLAIASNGIPIMIDDSGAAPNRWVVLKFTKSFYGREDLGLAQRLIAEREAITVWAIQGLQRLILSGKFTMPQSSIDEAHSLLDTSSPLMQFADDCLELDPEGKVHVTPLWECYKQWALSTNNKLSNRQNFFRALERTLQDKGVAYKKSVRIGNLVKTGMTGLQIAGTGANVTDIRVNNA